MVKLNKKYVIGTHVMWFEIEMYSDFIEGMVNVLICYNILKKLMKVK